MNKVPTLDLFTNNQLSFNQYKAKVEAEKAIVETQIQLMKSLNYYPPTKLRNPNQIFNPVLYSQAPITRYYDLTTQILQRKVGIENGNRIKYFYDPGQGNAHVPQNDKITKLNQPYTLVKDPYLYQNNQNPNRNKIQYNEQKSRHKIFENMSFGEGNKSNINKPEPSNKYDLETINSRKYGELLIELAQYENIDIKTEYCRDWMQILDQVQDIPVENIKRQLRRRIKEWKKEKLYLQESFVSNTEFQGESVSNQSIVRRELQQYDQRGRDFLRRIHALYEQVDELDYNLQNTTKSNQSLDIGQLIKLKNENINLHRECSNKINNLIEDYQTQKKPKQQIYSYFT